jgi:GH35 family endo-1,4-beta-xylanase
MKGKTMKNESWLRAFCFTGVLRRIVSLSVLIVGSSFFWVNGEGLRDAATKAGMYVGTALGGTPSGTMGTIVKNEFNMLVCVNAMKWDATEGQQGKFSFGGGDQISTYCTTNSYKMRGHTMVWHAQTPSWVQGLSRTAMLAAMKNHIFNLMEHFRGKILEWDICNECVADGSSSLRGSFWRTKIGDDFIDSAFSYAHQADSNVYLYYNDYSAEAAGSTKSDFVYNMVKGMKQRGIPIHGVGLQCHLTAPVNKDKISANIKRLGELGLRVSCTETDIVNGTTNPSSWTNLVQACVENYNATSFLTWGVGDADSWKGSGCNCLMWTTSYQSKASVYSAVQTAFNSADPAIVEQRKAFTALSPQELLRKGGTPVLASVKKESQRVTFNGNTLSYYLPANQNIHLQIIDMLGKVAVDLKPGMQTSGMHTLVVPRQVLPAGLYFAKINSGNQLTSIPFTRLN